MKKVALFLAVVVTIVYLSKWTRALKSAYGYA
jgi:hypothetical protein